MKLEYIESVYIESINKESKMRTKTEAEFKPDDGKENQLVNLYPLVQYQQIEGFGGAVTDSASYIFSLLNQEQKETMLTMYCNEDAMNYQMLRVPLDSCDFSLEHFEAMSNPNDIEMTSFSLNRMGNYIFPLLDAIREKAGRNLNIMVTPWSPPAFMKTNGERNHGGKLKKEYWGMWAEYICRYILELRKVGYHVTRMSLQNEPKAVQPWDSCIFTVEEEKAFLRDAMWPALAENQLQDVGIYIWDHNKERILERATTIIDEETSPMIEGIAFHWYSGDHFEALQMVYEMFPDKKLILSEACIEYSKYEQDDVLANAQKYAHDMIGNLNAGMTAFYDWNLILDEKGGPNHVGNYCDAPYLFDLGKQRLEERNILEYLWHFCHFIQPGARRIGYSRYTDQLEVTAWLNPDDQIVIIILNRSDKQIPFSLRLNNQCVELMAKPKSIGTGLVAKK